MTGLDGTGLDGTGQLHPAVAAWFAERFPEGATEPQRLAWPLVRSGPDVLIAAPTGSGKTLAGFLSAIDQAYSEWEAGLDIAGCTRVLYVSPLKALAVDIQQNLERPLAQIAEKALSMGLQPAPITIGVRTGDTAGTARAALVKAPPTILVTTPESLYLYLTADKSRATLTNLRTVIIDEIHALARDKRGAHLALSLERLEGVQAGKRPQRIGLSATQRPIELMAKVLSGNRSDQVQIVDCGHNRELRLSLEVPQEELAAVMSQEQLGEIVGSIAKHVTEHTTTLVFVNTRRLSERLAHLLGEVLGPDHVAAHHGSLSAERRKRTEARLRAGDLKALVATASLELGIDIGPVELVCQVGSPRSIATFLQRVGRSNHSRHGVPEGIIFPTTRDELVECAAVLRAVRQGRLDCIVPPRAPLDILAQQVIAEVAAAGECEESSLYEMFSRAAYYDELSRDDFDAVVELASEGIPTGRGPRMAFLHRDRVNGVLRPRRSARLAALTSGGAIPELGDYRVVAEPEDMFVGTVNEDFAIESMAGDVFLLGTHSWRVRRVTPGEVRVIDADGARPTIPFWVGEAPSRTAELSEEVSALRLYVSEQLSTTGPREVALLLAEHCGIDRGAAEQIVAYLDVGMQQLGTMPTQKTVVFERFFDEAGGMQLVVHAPFGGRINRGLGLALRKRFCVTFDFELQAAASDDAVILSLGPQHSFPLSSAPKMLNPNTVRTTLEQAVLASPMFTSRWRWDLSRALAILRFRGGKKNPLPVQRMEADDLMAAVFPALAACQENTAPGPVTLPDHVIVKQVMEDCLHEAMDVDGLKDLVAGWHRGDIATHFVDSVEPSVMAHEIVNSQVYTFLDDAPLEERRARQVQVRRGLPVEARDLSRLDPAALAKVREEVTAAPRDAEELHELLLTLLAVRPCPAWQDWFLVLSDQRRAMTVTPALNGQPGPSLWCPTERRSQVEALYPGANFSPDYRLAIPGSEGAATDPDEAAAMAMRGQLGTHGPLTVAELSELSALTSARARVGLARLEAQGYAMRGRFDPALDEEQWCARHLLARLHNYSQSALRRGTRPVSTEEFVRFLLRWQHVAPGTKRQGRAGLLAVIEQLQGWELAAGAWEEHVLPARVEAYQRRWLEDICLSGEVTWGRLSLRQADGRRGAATPSKATPVTFMLRSDMEWLARAKRGDAVPEEPSHGPGREILDALRARGAMFATELPAVTRRLPAEVQEGLWDLVARGLITADGFGAVRSLFSSRETWARRQLAGRRRPLRSGEGRWSLLVPHLLPAPDNTTVTASSGLDRDELAEKVATQLLARWGVVFWELVSHEDLGVGWRDILWALRRFEARGTVRGGRFVNGFAGEQYALPEALDDLHRRHDAAPVQLSGADPLNLSGVLLPGKRVPAIRTNSVAVG
ncbi:MAG TPA: DEAD/DEAH box helicase [Acidimicrobiales bacterium]|nr:DEAD/DEAH box helicase [Acidimicrobiales bacterium]